MRLGNIADKLGRKLSMQDGGRTQMGAFKVAGGGGRLRGRAGGRLKLQEEGRKAPALKLNRCHRLLLLLPPFTSKPCCFLRF